MSAGPSTACLYGWLRYGLFDQGVANALTQNADFFKVLPRLNDSSTILGAVLASFVLGAFFGCMTASVIGNKIGRRPFLICASVFTLVGAAGQAGAVDLAMFLVFRIVNGFAVGILTSIVPSFMAEISMPRIRGLMMSLELVFASTGLMTAFWVAYGFAKNQGPVGWRVPIGLQGLMEKGRVEEGRRVLERLHGSEYADAATLEIQEAIAIEHAAEEQAARGYAACFSGNDQCFRYRTLLSMGVNFFQQATGVNMATYYAGFIFIDSVGLEPAKASLALGGLGIAGLVACAVGCFVLMERLGRVRTMMWGAALCSLGQIFLAAGVAHGDKPAGGYSRQPLFELTTPFLDLFIAVFSATHLPTAFVYGAEIVPLAIRTRAATLGVATQYMINFLVVMTTPIGIAALGYKYYIIYAVSNGCIIPLAWYFCPEVAGLSLEGVDELFADGKVRMRRTTKVDKNGRLQTTAQFSGASEDKGDKGSFDHVDNVDPDKLDV
ncbi:SPOSA6832_02739 [Sporobolomyces salmonicolor]|uniref:SPOSA6832_02739-mRNA-1:cds n=1 Tax=Sporidiobolus salmonicolor TaxID=5005 RepID=A0A0D6EN61_SPOSA|nr:SPOSA6832_02739 [Sporobolomyces salmonicolor]